ncbi:MAG: hypothetical protein AAGJ18_11745 [Bacteroidota bacterium]
MRTLLFLLCGILILINCQNSTEASSPTVAEEIAQLTTLEKQNTFLEKIAVDDQYFRKKEADALRLHGLNSEEHQAALKKMMDMDTDHLQKIEAYLAKYGYPNKQAHTTRSMFAPWLVIHHASSDEPRRRNFKYFYEAYKKGDLEDNRLAFFLGRFYSNTFGERIRWDGPFTVQQELDSMLTALDLREITDKIDQKYE